MVYILRVGSKDPNLVKFHVINYLKEEEELSQPCTYIQHF